MGVRPRRWWSFPTDSRQRVERVPERAMLLTEHGTVTEHGTTEHGTVEKIGTTEHGTVEKIGVKKGLERRALAGVVRK